MNSRIVWVLAALLSVSIFTACEVEVGGFGASIGDDANFSITMYQGEGDVGGEQVDVRAVADREPLVLYFFGGQCEQCAGELSVLQAFHDEYGDRLTVLAVDVGHLMPEGKEQGGRVLLAEANATFPAGYTDDASVIRNHEIDVLPTTSFYKKGAGHYRHRVSGVLLQSDLLDGLDGLLD